MFTACTVTSPAYLPHARVMTASFLDHNPGAGLTLLYLGHTGRPGPDRSEALRLDPRVQVVEPDEVGVERHEVRRLGLMYSTQGLAGAMKARLLRHLVRRGDSPAMLIDSDICVFGSLEETAEQGERSGALFTTHIERPLPASERPMLTAGVFNSGFMVLGASGAALLDWWCDRTARHCIFRPTEGLLWEQAWLALAPAFFAVEVLRDPGVNAMGRELFDRDVEWHDGRPFLAGSPLRCYHFSGSYDPRSPEYLQGPAGADGGAPSGGSGFAARLSLEDRPGALEMSRRYAARLLEAGYADPRPAALYSDLREGLPVHRGMRRAYRSALIEAERSHTTPPPNAFDGASVEEFIRWLAEPPNEEAARDGLSRFALGAWDAHGAGIVFDRVPGRDSAAFLAWLAARLRRERSVIPAELLPSQPGASRRPPSGNRLGGLVRAVRARARGRGERG